MTINVAILGCSGRMGRNLIDAANQHKSISLAAGSVRKGSSFDGIDLGELAGIGSIGKNASSDLNSLVDADVLIDFTSIPSTFEHLKWCKEHNKAIDLTKKRLLIIIMINKIILKVTKVT